MPRPSLLERRSLNILMTIREKTSCPTQQTDDWKIERQICIKCSSSWKREVSKRHFKEPEDETDENRSLQEGTAHLGELVSTSKEITFQRTKRTFRMSQI